MLRRVTYNLGIASQCVSNKALGLAPGAFCVSGQVVAMIPMPCDRCETCYWLREFRDSRRCGHEAPEVETHGGVRFCRSYRQRTGEDWAALVYGNETVRVK